MRKREILCRELTMLTAEKGPVVLTLRKGPHGGVLVRAQLEDPVLSRWGWFDLAGDQSDDRYALEHLRELGLLPKSK